MSGFKKEPRTSRSKYGTAPSGRCLQALNEPPGPARHARVCRPGISESDVVPYRERNLRVFLKEYGAGPTEAIHVQHTDGVVVAEDVAFVGVIEAHDELEDSALLRTAVAEGDLSGHERAQGTFFQGNARMAGARRAWMTCPSVPTGMTCSGTQA